MLNDRDYMRPGSSRWTLRPQGSIVKPLIWANVIVFLLTGFGKAGPGYENQLLGLIKLHPYFIQRLEFWRIGKM